MKFKFWQIRYLSTSNLSTFLVWCTGNFKESEEWKKWNMGGKSGRNGNRASPGTKCASECKFESGRWGKSWCWTDPQETQWGAECVKCSGQHL